MHRSFFVIVGLAYFLGSGPLVRANPPGTRVAETLVNAFKADRIMPMRTFDRIALADAIFVGRVVGIEPQDIKMSPGPKAEKIDYRVAVIAVVDNFHGVKDKKTIRVAFIPPPNNPNQPRRGPFLPFQVQPGNEGVFHLRKHFAESVYVPTSEFDFITKESPEYKGEVDGAKVSGKILANPGEALKSKDAEQRLRAAGMLIFQYRQRKPNHNQQKPISAEETTLILNALLEADWNAQRLEQQLNPWRLFMMLNLTPENGYQPPNQVQGGLAGLRQHVLDWRKSEKGSTYQIQRYVADGK